MANGYHGYYTLLDTFKNYFNNHPLVTKTTYGNITGIDISKQSLFPLVHFDVLQVTPANNVIQVNFVLFAMDLVDVVKEEVTDEFVGNDNTIDIQNKIFIILMEFDKAFQQGLFWDLGYELVGDMVLEPFTDRFENLLTGFTVNFSVLIPNDISAC
jgi:hypothetical protein